MSINACTKFCGVKRGSHNFPRFIYHLTSKTNYEKMLQSGVMNPSQDALMSQKGIFAFDLKNLFKNWGKNKSWNNRPLIGMLLLFTNKNSKDIVMLKIPTGQLSLENLKIRSQNRYLGWRNKFLTLDNPLVQKICQISDKESFNAARREFCRSTNPQNASHIIEGTPARFSRLFNQRKEAIEYIYQGQIPMDCVEKIGEVNISKLMETPNQEMSLAKKIFMALTKGTPENQATVKLLK